MKTQTARAQAVARGEKTYQGAPCRRGHGGERRTSNRACVACKAAYRTAHRGAHREEKRARDIAYYAAHREEIRGKRAAHYATHREERAAYDATYAKMNPGAVRAKNASRRAMRLNQRCGCCTNSDLQRFFDITSLCGGRFAHVDHTIQLSLGGPHCCKNLEVLTAEDHKAKTKLDAAERAESRRRNRLLRRWANAAPVPVLQRAPITASTAPLWPTISGPTLKAAP